MPETWLLVAGLYPPKSLLNTFQCFTGLPGKTTFGNHGYDKKNSDCCVPVIYRSINGATEKSCG